MGRHKKVWWDNRHYVTVYELARAGESKAGIANAVGAPSTREFELLVLRDGVLEDALKRGEAVRERETIEVKSYQEYIHDRLPPNAALVYEQLMAAESGDASARQQAILLLEQAGEETKQRLFIHALHNCFLLRDACRLVGITEGQARAWARNDEGFAALVTDGLSGAKKDFWEAQLIKLGLAGDAKAIIHANKTLNRDRGYGERVEVNHTGQIQNNVTVNVFNLEDHLDKLSAGALQEILTLMEQAKNPVVIDALPAPVPVESDR